MIRHNVHGTGFLELSFLKSRVFPGQPRLQLEITELVTDLAR